jgi:hypothetical protein
MFWYGKYRIKLALCKLAQRSTSQISCSIVFSQQPPNMCHLPVRHCIDPFRWGYIFKSAGYSDEERLVGSRVYIPTCLPMARDEDGGSLPLYFLLWFCKVWYLCNRIYVVTFDTIARITIICTVVLSVIQGIALNTGVLPFLKGRTLHKGKTSGSVLHGLVLAHECALLVTFLYPQYKENPGGCTGYPKKYWNSCFGKSYMRHKMIYARSRI